MEVGWWALAVSFLSLAVSFAALAWNIHSFKRSGAILNVKLNCGVRYEYFDKYPDDEEWCLRRPDGTYQVTIPTLRITLENTGRAAVDVVSVFVGDYDSKSRRAVMPSTIHKKLPARLESGSLLEARVDAKEVFDGLDGIHPHFNGELVVTVTLGSGVKVTSNKLAFDELASVLGTSMFRLNSIQLTD